MNELIEDTVVSYFKSVCECFKFGDVELDDDPAEEVSSQIMDDYWKPAKILSELIQKNDEGGRSDKEIMQTLNPVGMFTDANGYDHYVCTVAKADIRQQWMSVSSANIGTTYWEDNRWHCAQLIGAIKYIRENYKDFNLEEDQVYSPYIVARTLCEGTILSFTDNASGGDSAFLISARKEDRSAVVESFDFDGMEDDHDDELSGEIFDAYTFVDMKLPSGTLWAKWNIGADKENPTGNQYQWACPLPYNEDADDTYAEDHRKYRCGMRMKQEDDPADAWIKGCSTPTIDQCRELLDNCRHEIVENYMGMGMGCVFTSKADPAAKLFFPMKDLPPKQRQWYDGYFTFRVWAGSMHPSLRSYAYELIGHENNDVNVNEMAAVKVPRAVRAVKSRN